MDVDVLVRPSMYFFIRPGIYMLLDVFPDIDVKMHVFSDPGVRGSLPPL